MALIYGLLILSQIDWGIPRPGRVFVYQMDEWHTLQAVRGVYKLGSNNIPGAAAGPMLFYLMSGLGLVPWVATGIVHIKEITSAYIALGEQQKIFWILRSFNMIWGVGALIFFDRILRDFFGLGQRTRLWAALLWLWSPIWVTLSGYFKYDIAVAFWLTANLYFALAYIQKKSLKFLWLAAIVSGLGIATKISALPSLGLVLWAWFAQREGRSWKNLGQALLIVGVLFATLGAPDVIFRGRNWGDQPKDVFIDRPHDWDNLRIAGTYWQFLLTREFPEIFGYGLYGLALLGIWHFFRKPDKNSFTVSLGLLGAYTSLTFLGIWGGSNRASVLLPYGAVLAGTALGALNWRRSIAVVLITWQMGQSITWLGFKWRPDLRQTSQILTLKPVGVENIPIYQMLPDQVLLQVYRRSAQFPVISVSASKLPDTVLVTDDQIEPLLWRKTAKTELLQRLSHENFRKTQGFSVDMGVVNPIIFKIANLIPMPLSIGVYER